MRHRYRFKKNKKKILTVVLAAMCVFAAGCANPVEEGTELLKENKYTEAQEMFQKAVEKEQNPGEAYRGLGICYWEQEEYEKAAEAFGKALDCGTEETATIYNMLGICALKTDKPEKAVYYFENGQNFVDAEEELLQEMSFNLVVAYEEVGDFASAREKLQLYVSLYPEDEAAAKELEFLNTQAPGTEEE